MTPTLQPSAHSTYCNCKACCTPFVDHSKMSLSAFKAAVMRKGYDMFGPGVQERWTGKREEPVLTPEQLAELPANSPLRRPTDN